jgi:hypothetical protein
MIGQVSFDVFLQSFRCGEAASGEPGAALRELEPYLVGAPSSGCARVRTGDGNADVYGLGGADLMINQASGELIWQVIVDVARAAGYAIMPVGCPVCVVRDEMIDDLPGDLQDGALVVRSGGELLRAIAQA